MLASFLIASALLGPRPPCAGAGPVYPEVNQPAVTSVWSGRDRSWIPPACTGWSAPGYTALVETAGTVRVPGGEAALLRRIGAIRSLAGVRYWSITHGRWQPLVLHAAALRGPEEGLDREDFTPGELTSGQDLYFQQEDSLTGSVVYRLRVLESGEQRVVFETENVAAVRYWLKEIFAPGDLQSTYFFERLSDDLWRFYNLARTGARASRLATGHEASSVNRAVAFYRHYAGIPTDLEPPAAP